LYITLSFTADGNLWGEKESSNLQINKTKDAPYPFDMPRFTSAVNSDNTVCPTRTSAIVCGYVQEAITITLNDDGKGPLNTGLNLNTTDYGVYLIKNGISSSPLFYIEAEKDEYEISNTEVIFNPKVNRISTLATNTLYNIVLRRKEKTADQNNAIGRAYSCPYGTTTYYYLGSKSTLAVSPTDIYHAYPDDGPFSIKAAHNVSTGIADITGVAYKKIHSTTYAPATNYTTDKVSNTLSYTLSNIVFNKTTITSNDPDIRQEYDIQVQTSSGNVLTGLTIHPTSTDVLIIPVEDSGCLGAPVQVGTAYSKKFKIICNTCDQYQLNTTKWAIISGEDKFQVFPYAGSNVVQVILQGDNGIVLDTAYSYTLSATINLSSSPWSLTVFYTCSFTGTSTFAISTTSLKSTYVGASFTQKPQLSTINHCPIPYTIEWSMGPTAAIEDYPDPALGLTLNSKTGDLSWMPVAVDPNVTLYPKSYQIQFTAKMYCGTTYLLTAVATKDLILQVDAPPIIIDDINPK
ncbi:MAG: hypothetical protein WCJ49_09355, partial [Deltaproteobacteria bacterium]